MHQTKKSYIHQLDGMGRKMPVVFGIFTLSGMALMGVPGMAGFISKWNLATAAVESENVLAYVGIGALLISALLTAIYMLTISMRAFFPSVESETGDMEEYKDPNWMMLLPLGIFAVVIVGFGLYSGPIMNFFTNVANGMY